MDLSSLETTAKSLETSLDRWSCWLSVSTILVVVGLIVEYGPDLAKLVKIRPFDKHLLLTMVGGALVTIGVAGELGAQLFASTDEASLRSTSHQIEGLLVQNAARADERSKKLDLEISDAKKEEARLSVEAETAKSEIAKANQQAKEAEAEQYRLKAVVNWRVITPENLNTLANALSKSSGTVTLRYVATDSEALGLAVQISKAFAHANQIAGRVVWRISADPHLYPNRLVFLTHIPDLNNENSRALQKAFSEATIEYQPDDIVEQEGGAAGVAGMTIGKMRLQTEALIIVGSKLPPF